MKSRGTFAWSLSALRAQRPPCLFLSMFGRRYRTSCAGNIQRWNHQASLALCPYTAKRLGLLGGSQKETIDWTGFGGQHVWHIWTVESSPWMKSWIHQRYATLCNMFVLPKQTVEQSSTFGCCMLWLRFPAPFCFVNIKVVDQPEFPFPFFWPAETRPMRPPNCGLVLSSTPSFRFIGITSKLQTMEQWVYDLRLNLLIRCVVYFWHWSFHDAWFFAVKTLSMSIEEPKHICMAKQFCATNLIPIDTF